MAAVRHLGFLRRAAGGHADVDRLGERDGGHVAQVHGALRRDGEHREDAERDARRDRLEVDPEGDPRQEDDEDAGQEGRQHVGTQTTLQVDVRPQTRERTLHSRQLTIMSRLCYEHDICPSVRLLVDWINNNINNKKHLKNVGPIHYSEPPHAALPFTRRHYCLVTRRLRIDVHDDDDDDNA